MSVLLNIVVLASFGEKLAAVNYKTIIIASLVIALIVGFIRMMILKGQLTSVHKSESAADYTRDKSFRVDTKRDLFLYSKTEKKEKPNSTASK
jgi:hypothetical protein